MNSFTKKVAKAVVSTVVLGGILLTTACAPDSHPAASAPTSPAASQSDTETPTPTPTESEAPVVIDASVYKTFPTETPDTVKEGVTFALSTYQGLVGVNNFYHARTASDNTLLVPVAEKFDKTYYDAMTARTTAHDGQIQDIISFGKDGGIGKDAPVEQGGIEHYMKPDANIQFVTGSPVVYAAATENNGNVLVVNAQGRMLAPTTDNKLVTIKTNYWISITHAGPNKWLVTELGYHMDNNPTFSDSVKAPDAK